MPEFVFVYRAPSGYEGSPDEGQKWNAWFNDLGGAVVEAGEPVFTRTLVGECGLNTNLGGYSVVKADSLEQAAEFATDCPIIVHGGGVEVGELTPISIPRG